jgi:hypothetical protein
MTATTPNPTRKEVLTRDTFLARDLPEVLCLVKEEHRTGSLVLHFNSGGMQEIEWNQKTKPLDQAEVLCDKLNRRV